MKSIKILTLGNSYSNDAYAWLYPIFESAGYKDVILGYIINGGCNINHHWSNVDSDTSNDYGAECFINNNGKDEKYIIGENSTLRDTYKSLISIYEWDYVIIQHGPKHVELRDTYSHLRDLLDFVKDNLKSPNAKFIYHMIWKYNDNIVGGSTANAYADILDITKNIVLSNDEFVGVIPAATMRQNMMSSYLTDEDIARDYGHMGLGFGRFVLGLLWYSYITGGSVDDISFIPTPYEVHPELLERFVFDEVTEEKMIIAKEAITNALAHPYEITKSEFASLGDKSIVMDNLNIDEHIAAVGGEHVE